MCKRNKEMAELLNRITESEICTSCGEPMELMKEEKVGGPCTGNGSIIATSVTVFTPKLGLSKNQVKHWKITIEKAHDGIRTTTVT